MEIKESTVLHRIKDNSIKLVKEVGIGDWNETRELVHKASDNLNWDINGGSWVEGLNILNLVLEISQTFSNCIWRSRKQKHVREMAISRSRAEGCLFQLWDYLKGFVTQRQAYAAHWWRFWAQKRMIRSGQWTLE
jgi:hypothetical protein